MLCLQPGSADNAMQQFNFRRKDARVGESGVPMTGGSMPTCDDILLLARYNATMNRQLYDAAATLPHEAVVADRGASSDHCWER